MRGALTHPPARERRLDALTSASLPRAAERVFEAAAALRALLDGSEIRESHLIGDERVQDPYCIRCQPQVDGACLDLLRQAARTLVVEANAVTDNPLVLSDGSVVSGGNFHAEPVAFAADQLALAICEIGSIAQRRIALCGLNPHAGEAALFGEEERDVLQPAVAALRAEGVDISGPLPADSLFVRAIRGEFDAVIANYHDQGLIPVKLAAFGHSVNVTLGLPFVRTSVDHGTGFDIVEKGVADGGSLVQAMKAAVELSKTTPNRAAP